MAYDELECEICGTDEAKSWVLLSFDQRCDRELWHCERCADRSSGDEFNNVAEALATPLIPQT